MTYTLTLCFGIYFGMCGQIRQFDFPTLKECQEEREAIFASPVKPYYAVCAPKQALK